MKFGKYIFSFIINIICQHLHIWVWIMFMPALDGSCTFGFFCIWDLVSFWVNLRSGSAFEPLHMNGRRHAWKAARCSIESVQLQGSKENQFPNMNKVMISHSLGALWQECKEGQVSNVNIQIKWSPSYERNQVDCFHSLGAPPSLQGRLSIKYE